MAGYGGQLVALNVDTPSQLMEGAANASMRNTASQLASATLPDEVAMSGIKRQSSALALADQRTASTLKTQASNEEMIARAAALATDADSWDAAMQKLADAGNVEARQFVGRYSENLRGRVANAYGAATPSSALGAMNSDSPTGVGGAESGLASVAGNSGAGVTEGATPNAFDAQFAHIPAAQLQGTYQKLEATRHAIQAVAQSPNPSAEWDKQVAQMGHPEWVGKYSPQTLQQLTQETVPLDNYLRGRLTREGMGVPQARPAAKVDNVGGTLYAVDESDPANPKATPLTPQGKGTFVGTDKDGHGIYYDPVTGKETHGTAVLSTSRYTPRGGRDSVYALKQSAWLQSHPGDTQGALDYAAGLKGKTMTAQQVQVSAQLQAARELSDLAMAGNPPQDGEAFITARTQEIEQTLMSKAPGADGGPSPPPPPPIPITALSALKDGKPHQFHVGGRIQTWQMKAGKPVRIN